MRRIIRCVMTDLVRGVRKNIVKYILFTVFLLTVIIVFDKMVLSDLTQGCIKDKPGIFDTLLYLFSGNDAFNAEKNNIFVMRPAWLVMSVTPAFLVYSYAASELEGMGLHFLLKEGSRKIWWLGKCVWNCISVLIMYVITYGILFVKMLIEGQDFASVFTVHKDICREVVEINIVPDAEAMMFLVLIPICIYAGMSLLQMALSLILNPAVSFLFVVTVYVVSAYASLPFLPGGYTMVKRWNIAGLGGGLNPQTGILIAVIMGTLGVIGGLLYLKKMDIYGKE